MARTPVLPIFAADLGAMPELIGVIVAASTITGVFFKLPSGALSDVLGRKRMMVLGALFFAAPPFLYPFVQDPWSLLALRFVHGFATAIFSPVASAYVASLAETGRGARLGWFSSANDIGATAGPLIGGFVLYFTTSYSLTYLLVGALGVITLLVVLLLPDVDRAARPRQRLSPRARQSSGRASPRCSGHRRSSSRPASKPSCISAMAPFSASCRSTPRRSGSTTPRSRSCSARSWPWPWWRSRSPDALSDRVGRIPVIIIGLLLCAAALPLIFRSESLTAFVLFAPLLGLGVGAVTPVTNALIADLASSRRLGAAMGVFGTIWDIGEAAGPMIAGFLIGGLGYAGTFDVLAAVTAAATVGVMALVRDPKKRCGRRRAAPPAAMIRATITMLA